MTIKVLERRRALVTFTGSELCGCGVSFGGMGLSDPPTRVLLHDLLTLLGHMGLTEPTRPVTIECAPSPDGGCALLIGGEGEPNGSKTIRFSRHEPSPGVLTEDEGRGSHNDGDALVRFASCDDIIDAAAAGALPAPPLTVERRDGEWLLRLTGQLTADQRALLSEFTEPDV